MNRLIDKLEVICQELGGISRKGDPDQPRDEAGRFAPVLGGDKGKDHKVRVKDISDHKSTDVDAIPKGKRAGINDFVGAYKDLAGDHTGGYVPVHRLRDSMKAGDDFDNIVEALSMPHDDPPLELLQAEKQRNEDAVKGYWRGASTQGANFAGIHRVKLHEDKLSPDVVRTTESHLEDLRSKGKTTDLQKELPGHLKQYAPKAESKVEPKPAEVKSVKVKSVAVKEPKAKSKPERVQRVKKPKVNDYPLSVHDRETYGKLIEKEKAGPLSEAQKALLKHYKDRDW